MRQAGHKVATLDIVLNGNDGEYVENDRYDLLSDPGFAYHHRNIRLKTSNVTQCFLLVNIPQILTWDPRLALATVTNAKFDKCFCLCGLLCRSFCGVNKGTHARSPWDPLGNTSYSHVREGNQLCARTLGFKVSDQKIKQGT